MVVVVYGCGDWAWRSSREEMERRIGCSVLFPRLMLDLGFVCISSGVWVGGWRRFGVDAMHGLSWIERKKERKKEREEGRRGYLLIYLPVLLCFCEVSNESFFFPVTVGCCGCEALLAIRRLSAGKYKGRAW